MQCIWLLAGWRLTALTHDRSACFHPGSCSSYLLHHDSVVALERDIHVHVGL